MRRKRSRPRLLATLLAGALLGMAGPTLPAVASGGPSLTTGRTAKASSADGEHLASVVNDGDQNTYWQSRSRGGKSSWVQSDLGRTRRIDRVVLRLPAAWQARKETLALQGSVDGTSFNTLKPSATYAFTPGAGNTVTVPVPSVNARYVRVTVSHNDRSRKAQLAELDAYSAADSTTNLAAGRTATASSYTDVYPAPNATDGNAATYWESRNGAFPQWLQVDLGTAVAVNRFTLRLPSSWEPRSQTLKVQGSTNGTAFTDLVASASYDWNSANGNAVTLSTDTATTRYVRVTFTANSVQNGGQLSELEVYGPDTADTQAPTAPTDLTYTEPGSGQIKLTWKAATDNKGVTGYDVYADNTLR
ncbi:discoidin domain-containing protein, partial [Streptomyces sp. NPDC059740]|uniref:discoidin domain-containing protein n=1 Tax=Streptomyces sp. NPDC059740 TaxID=3346926 RepID=UPI00365934B1